MSGFLGGNGFGDVAGPTGPPGATGVVPWTSYSGITNQFISSGTSTGPLAQMLVTETVLNPSGTNPVYGFVNYMQTTGTNAGLIASFTPPTGILQDWIVSVVGLDTVSQNNYYRADLPFTVVYGAGIPTGRSPSGMIMQPTGSLPLNIRYGASGIGYNAIATSTATAVNILVNGTTGIISWTAVGQISQVK